VRDEGGAHLLDAVREGELEAGLEELLDVGTADILGLLELDHTENVDRPEASTVPGSHILVQGLHRIRAGELTELLVHVVGTGARVVAQPDAEVLDLQRLLLVNNVDAKDFSTGFFNLLELPQEVPEARLGDDLIRRENPHAIDFRVGVVFGGQMAPDDLELLERHLDGLANLEDGARGR